jgi:hypothetical protein
MYVGNYDGMRRGLVVTTSVEKAAILARTSRRDFSLHWARCEEYSPEAYPQFLPETLYTSPIFAVSVSAAEWTVGRCHES